MRLPVVLPPPSVAAAPGRLIAREVSPYLGAVSGDRFVIVGLVIDRPDIQALIVDALGVEAARGFIRASWSFEDSQNSDDLVVMAEDGRVLRFDPAMYGWDLSLLQRPRSESWVSDDGLTWRVRSIDPRLQIGSVVGVPGGFVAEGRELDASGQPGEPIVLASRDGLSWTSETTFVALGEPVVVSLASKGDQAVALVAGDSHRSVYSAVQPRSLWATTEGEQWAWLGDTEVIYPHRAFVIDSRFGSGDAGYLLVQRATPEDLAESDPVTFVDGVKALTINGVAGMLTIVDTVTTEVLWEMSYDPVEGAGDEFRVNGSGGSVNVIDPTSGKLIFKLTAEIIAESGARRYARRSTKRELLYMWYSSDGQRWTLITTPGEAQTVEGVVVGDVLLAIASGQLWVLEPPAADR